MSSVRNSAKAIIIEDGHILVVKYAATDGFVYCLPGGGQQNGEPLTNALKRECLEEISSAVDVGELLFIREYIGHHYDRPGYHQVELMFHCTLQDGYECINGHETDIGQIGVEWLPIDRLDQYRLYPKAIIPLLMNEQYYHEPVYLGDVE